MTKTEERPDFIRDGETDRTDDIVMAPTRWVLRHADGTQVLRFKGQVSSTWDTAKNAPKPFVAERPISSGGDPYGHRRPGYFASIVLGELNCQVLNNDGTGTWSKYGQGFDSPEDILAVLAEFGPDGDYATPTAPQES